METAKICLSKKADGDSYLKEGVKVPFKKRKELIVVKDSSDVEIEIRSTERGPIISDFPVFNILTEDVVSLRWSLAETKSSSLGLDRLLETQECIFIPEGPGGDGQYVFQLCHSRYGREYRPSIDWLSAHPDGSGR